MALKKKDNRVKRKRGKKFTYHGDAATASTLETEAKVAASNPFENHSKSKRAKKDMEARADLI